MSLPPVSVIDQISASLSVASLKNQVIASNIANRDTQGYQRLKVEFERAMDEAGAPRVATDTSVEPASLEQDLIALSTNSGKYGALTRVLSRYFSIVSAITSHSRG